MSVYLAGLISTDHPESLAWREEAAFRLVEGWGLDVLSPVRGKDMAKSMDGGLSTPDQGSKSIIMRDYNDIRQATLMLANLNLWGSTRPLVGTLMELAWAWEMKMPVVAVCDKNDTLMRNHPFIKECVSHYCETMEEAIDFVGRYYA